MPSASEGMKVLYLIKGGVFFRLCKGDLQEENTALAQLAFNPHAAAMLFGNGFNDRKPQAEPCWARASRCVPR